MAAHTADWVVEQGADFHAELPDVDDHGRPRNRVGWNAQAAIRHTADTEILAKPRVEFLPGRVVVTVAGGQSARWTWRRSRYEIQMRGPQGQRERFATGRVTLDPTLLGAS